MHKRLIKQGAEPRKILQIVCENNIPAIMSYQSREKWHVCKVTLVDMGACSFEIEIAARKKPHPMNIQREQPVGFSIKYGYGKVIFESMVIGFAQLQNSDCGGRIVLSVPSRIELVERRSYFRVQVPRMLNVKTCLWHRRKNIDGRFEPDKYWEGQLVDISAGGAQLVVEAGHEDSFKAGQFIGMRFVPLPYEKPLAFNAQIRNILPTADGQCLCLGLQIVGLEATEEGRDMLSRLCGVVEMYHKINQSGITINQLNEQNSE
ncbi:MAG: PilZ domain-containing protein [Phycisphaerae bacterium]|nr:PilZ domain-containing protein [Phycisphaerae bacterium]